MSDDVLEQLRQQERETAKRLDELIGLQDEITELTDKRRRLRQAIAVLDGSVKSNDPRIGVSARVLKLLQESDRPLHIGTIAEALAFEITQVRSAVRDLHRKGEVHNVERGVWAAVDVAQLDRSA